jgi:nucleoid-associated protein YgaU
MTTQDQVIALARASKRPSGKCLGFTNNDVVGAFGKMGRYPDFATQAADELEKAGQLYTTPCPDYPHVDFYDYVATIQGVRKNWGHTDWHFPQRGLHVANSSRVTANKNATGTTGTYASYGGARRGWAKVPALGAQISIVNDATPTPPPPSSGGGKKDVDTVAREVIAGNWGNGQDRRDRLTAAGYDYATVQGRVNEMLDANSTTHRTYTVQPGDTLSGIAGRLRYPGGWKALWNKNRGVIGSNPNLIHPGQRLSL